MRRSGACGVGVLREGPSLPPLPIGFIGKPFQVRREFARVAGVRSGIVVGDGLRVDRFEGVDGPRERVLGADARGDAGVACTQADACLAGLLCDFTSGVCVAPGGEGAACNDNSLLCTTGLACQPASDGGVSRCARYASRGELCGQCKLDLRCLRDGGVDGVCGDLSGDGGDCFSDSDCAAPLWCNALSMQCQPPPGEGDSCAGTPCPAGLGCVVGDGGAEVCVSIDGGAFDVTCSDTGEP